MNAHVRDVRNMFLRTLGQTEEEAEAAEAPPKPVKKAAAKPEPAKKAPAKKSAPKKKAAAKKPARKGKTG